MNVPKLRFKEFNDEWKKAQLSSFVNINPKNDSLPEKFIYIDLESVNNGLLTSRKIINKSEAPSRAQRTIIKNDILYQTVRPYQMNNLFINSLDSTYPYIASTGYALLRTEENPYFVYSILHQKSFVNKVLDKCTGTSYPAISANDLGAIIVGLPSIKEQEKISRTFELLDKKIELQSKKIEDLKLFKKGLLYNEKRNNNLWNEYKISDIMNITRGTVIPKTEISECLNNEFRYPVYSSQTSNNGILGYDNKYDFNGKFLTWTTDGANAGKVFYREGKFRCTNVCGILYNKDNRYVSELTAELLNIETPKYVSYVGNPKLMNNVMSNIIIKLPDPSRDYFFSSILKIINKKLTIEEEKLDKLFELKKGLMQNMFV